MSKVGCVLDLYATVVFVCHRGFKIQDIMTDLGVVSWGYVGLIRYAHHISSLAQAKKYVLFFSYPCSFQITLSNV
jgi:hypothetical protein